VLNSEPIRRGNSRPHFVEWLSQRGGVRVMPCRHYPNGLTLAEWAPSIEALLDGYVSSGAVRPHGWHCQKRFGASWVMRDAEVYALGRVWHPDHATIRLQKWHRVYLSDEVVDRRFQAFLD
jgi:hypothetical protein